MIWHIDSVERELGACEGDWKMVTIQPQDLEPGDQQVLGYIPIVFNHHRVE